VRTSFRIALVAGLLALATNLAIIGFIEWRTYDESESTLRRQVTQQAHVLADIYKSGGRDSLENAIDDALDPDDPQAGAAILDRNAHLIYGNITYVPIPGEALGEGYRPALIRLQDAVTSHEAGLYLQRLPRGQWLANARIAGEGLTLRNTLESSLLVGMALSLLLGIACGVLVARYVGHRVRAIGEVAAKIGSGDFGHRIPLGQSGDAFEGLGRQINAMLDRIATLMSELQLLTDTLAHDLRSPVGRLRAAADAALGARSSEERDQFLANIIQQSDSLMRILTTILEIARTESFASRKQFACFDAAKLGAEMAEMYEPLAEEAGARLTFELAGSGFELNGHRQLLAQALSNLIENALNYAASGGEITVFTKRSGDCLSMGVSDRGPGVPADLREQACQRFGRLDSSRSSVGAGLGLALARSIAHLHSGELVLDDAEPGLVASLELPIGGSAD
jgi:signal transduction histidine kinase